MSSLSRSRKEALDADPALPRSRPTSTRNRPRIGGLREQVAVAPRRQELAGDGDVHRRPGRLLERAETHAEGRHAEARRAGREPLGALAHDEVDAPVELDAGEHDVVDHQVERVPVPDDLRRGAVGAATEVVRRADEHERKVLALARGGGAEAAPERDLASPDDERSARWGSSCKRSTSSRGVGVTA